LSAASLAEVQKTIRERHASLDGGLTPPPRVVSLEDSRGFKVMTELVDHDLLEKNSPDPEEIQPERPPSKNKNLSSKYTPLQPISKRK
jgi:hypothetical protein